ncbi:4-diphosphocytidyl-2-C-methyl-D-erythritol kinase [Motilibacter rhizosphaerae]|uniref:4-diphosphocytidyl-2-C-methyl-D-erythritol kinase n=1 Tax=Motilibacter rhizosphaerae TaxID=598652 RepID=A0A4Q7NQ45_9ACTN|nr:4-(cytidine 5'-diphospho)-2-C-methyl-D-erythritol kinase [Motilibacter rhizosphaerae]RZS87431.1 4-diphosphocytidyl-2-C-methyl-D-erythritol kinase [Motilibacter rhizosphaerae]
MGPVRVRVPAKVNLQLAVGPVRPDGFHELVTVFCSVGLHDDVTVTTSDETRVRTTGPEAHLVPAGADNLAARAAEALARRAGVSSGVDITIDKDIPVAGGMAGGSADAAAVLLACNEIWGLHWPAEELVPVAAEVGSDVAFGLLGGVAVGRGRGELLEPVGTTAEFAWAFAFADEGLSTPEVFRTCDRLREGVDVPQPEVAEDLLAALHDGDAAALAASLANDLQPAALALRPGLADVLAEGTRAGALAGIVSGSGPTCAFLCPAEAVAAVVGAALAGLPGVRRTRTARGPAGSPQLAPVNP